MTKEKISKPQNYRIFVLIHRISLNDVALSYK